MSDGLEYPKMKLHTMDRPNCLDKQERNGKERGERRANCQLEILKSVHPLPLPLLTKVKSSAALLELLAIFTTAC